MGKGIFVTGTDTGVGKTGFSLALMVALKDQGHQVVGMKPIASGADLIGGALINDDAKQIREQSSLPVSYELINPFVFKAPIAPHIAAKRQNEEICLNKIVFNFNQLASTNDITIVEGVGGWRVPFAEDFSAVDIVCALKLPVVLVVGLRLGCISHAILTSEAIRADGVNLIAWASSQLEKDYLHKTETIQTLNKYLDCPHIADFPYQTDLEPQMLSKKVDLSSISAFIPCHK